MKKNDVVNISFGERIRIVRKHYHLPVSAFAERLGISVGYVSLIENDKRKPKDALVKLLLSEFSISKQWLESGEGEMTTEEGDLRAAVSQIVDEGETSQLSEEEELLIKCYRKMDMERKQRMIVMASTAALSSKEKK